MVAGIDTTAQVPLVPGSSRRSETAPRPETWHVPEAVRKSWTPHGKPARSGPASSSPHPVRSRPSATPSGGRFSNASGDWKVRPEEELRAEIRAAAPVPRLTEEAAETFEAVRNTLRWVLGETDDLYPR
jgi:hypothetical protein